MTYTAVFDSADKYVAEAIELINALPEAEDITDDDADAVDTARAAYDALTNEQKALIDAETLIKLEAAEEALIPELVDVCYIEIDNDAIYLGDEITVCGAASSGARVIHMRSTARNHQKLIGAKWLSLTLQGAQHSYPAQQAEDMLKDKGQHWQRDENE